MVKIYEFPRKEDIRITIGDEKQQNFFPRLKIERWDNEVNFSVGIISTFHGSHDKVGDKVEWNDGHGVGAKFYEKPGDQFEFEIILDEKPASGFVLLSIETKGLQFLYQPKLTQEEINNGAFRPEDVVGSYAVYHESKQDDYSQMGGKNYRAGKAFHIYRPKIIDNVGKEVWGRLNIDIGEKSLTIEIPQEFLDNAVYPVIVDPTFGYESAGASFFEGDIDRIRTRIGNPGENGTAVSISASVRKALGVSKNIQGALYLNSDASLLSPQTAENLVTDTNQHWEVLNFTNGPAVSNQNYDIAVFFDNPDDSNKAEIAYDSGGVSGDSKYSANDALNYNSWPADYSIEGSFSDSASKYSIYCTYTLLSIPVAMNYYRRRRIA